MVTHRASFRGADRPLSSRADGAVAGDAAGAGGATAEGVAEGGGRVVEGGGGVVCDGVGVGCARARDRAAVSPLPSATARISWGLMPSSPRSAVWPPALSEPCTYRCAAITSA